MEILKNPNYDFLGKTKYFVAPEPRPHRCAASPTCSTAGRALRRRVLRAAPSSSCASRDRPRSTACARPWTRSTAGRRHPDLRRPRQEPGAHPRAPGTETATEGELDAAAKSRARSPRRRTTPRTPWSSRPPRSWARSWAPSCASKAIQLTVLGLALPAHLHRRSASRARCGARRRPSPSSTTCSSPRASSRSSTTRSP